MVERYGGNVIRAEGEWGGPLDPKAVESALDSVDRVKMLAVVHGETSTGVLQPLEGFADMAYKRGALFLIDCVTSLGRRERRRGRLGGRHRLLGGRRNASARRRGSRRSRSTSGRSRWSAPGSRRSPTGISTSNRS